jgi:hypothetical protein
MRHMALPLALNHGYRAAPFVTTTESHVDHGYVRGGLDGPPSLRINPVV